MVTRKLEFAVELAGMFDPPTTKSLIQRVESLGYTYLWWADYRFYRDVYSLLTQTAIYSQELKFGTFVTDPFVRHPALTAVAIATVDELSGGRVTMSIGAGVSGLREMGIRRTRPAKRISEAIDLIRTLWREGRADYEGETVCFREGELDFKPRPDIPIFVASNSPITLGVAGEKADGVIVEGLRRQEMMDYTREHVEKGLKKAGRDWEELNIIARLDLCIHDDREIALEVLRTRVQHYVSVHGASRWQELARLIPPELENEIRSYGFTHDPQIIENLAAKIPVESTMLIALGGTEDDVRAQVEAVARLGVTQISVFPIPSKKYGITIPELIERFGNIIQDFR